MAAVACWFRPGPEFLHTPTHLQLSQIYYGIFRRCKHACRLRLLLTAAVSLGVGTPRGASESPPPSLLKTEKGPVQAVDFRLGGISHLSPGQSSFQLVWAIMRMGDVVLSSRDAILFTYLNFSLFPSVFLPGSHIFKKEGARKSSWRYPPLIVGAWKSSLVCTRLWGTTHKL